MTNTVASEALGVATRTLSRSRTSPVSESPLAEIVSHPGTTRERIAPQLAERAVDFWRQHCRASATHVRKVTRGSGETVPVLWQVLPTVTLWKQYCDEEDDGHVGLTKFVELCPFNVRLLGRRWGYCPTCDDGKKAENRRTFLLASLHSKCPRGTRRGGHGGHCAGLLASVSRLFVDLPVRLWQRSVYNSINLMR